MKQKELILKNRVSDSRLCSPLDEFTKALKTEASCSGRLITSFELTRMCFQCSISFAGKENEFEALYAMTAQFVIEGVNSPCVLC